MNQYASTTGKVVLITGGSRGIGYATACQLASAGLRVAIAARDERTGQRAARAIMDAGGEAIFIQADVSSADESKAMVDSCISHYGSLDFAFNNAGTSGVGSVHEVGEEAFDKSFITNVRGLWLSMKYELLHMRHMRNGSIVNNVSVHGYRAVFPGIASYVASKHAALGLTRAAALENRPLGIRVNGVAPGPIEGEMLRASETVVGGANAWIRMIPAGRVGQPAEVADVVHWLLSDRSSFVSGEVISVDGGFMSA